MKPNVAGRLSWLALGTQKNLYKINEILPCQNSLADPSSLFFALSYISFFPIALEVFTIIFFCTLEKKLEVFDCT